MREEGAGIEGVGRVRLGGQTDLRCLPRRQCDLGRANSSRIRLGGEQADGRYAAAIDGDLACGNAREIPRKTGVGARALVRGREIAGLLRLLPQLEQLDEFRREVRPELSAGVEMNVAEVALRGIDARLDVRIRERARLRESCLVAGEPVERQLVPEGRAIADHQQIEPTRLAGELQRIVAEHGALLARHLVELSELGHLRSRPLHVARCVLSALAGQDVVEVLRARHQEFGDRQRAQPVDLRIVLDQRRGERMQRRDDLHRALHVGVVVETLEIGVPARVRVVHRELGHGVDRRVERLPGIAAVVHEAERSARDFSERLVPVADDEQRTHGERRSLPGCEPRIALTEERREGGGLRLAFRVAQHYAEPRVCDRRQAVRTFARIDAQTVSHAGARHERQRQTAHALRAQ